jgi:hypothetical protein
LPPCENAQIDEQQAQWRIAVERAEMFAFRYDAEAREAGWSTLCSSCF